MIALDIETHDPELQSKGPGTRRDGRLVGVTIRTEDWTGEYYPTGHVNGPNCDQEQVLAWLRDGFKRLPPRTPVTGTNLLYEGEYLEFYGLDLSNCYFMPVDWAEALLDENLHSYNLDAIATRWLGHGKVNHELKQLYGPNYIQNFHRVHPGHARAYGFGDVDLPLEILPLQLAQLEKENLRELYDIECRLMPFLLYLRRTGVPVNVKAAEHLGEVLREHLDREMRTMEQMVGFPVNPNAGQSIAAAFDKLGLGYPRTSKGNPSFVADWLELHPEGSLANHIIKARKYEKFKGTFVDSYILKNHIEGIIYGQFHPLKQTESGTVTGRFSSSNPDLQNIPIHDETLGPLMREMFIPRPGRKWWSLDWSQLEYRFLVHYAVLARCTGADKAAEMYRKNPRTDFHKFVADLTGLDRDRYAKHLNFGLVYGMGVWLLALQLGLVDQYGAPLPEAYEIFETYNREAPFIKQMQNLAGKRAADMNYVRTFLNRRRRFNCYEPWGFWELKEGRWVKVEKKPPRNAPRPPGLPWTEAVELYQTENLKVAYVYKALNAVLQGSAADLMKLAMVLAWEAGCFGPGKPLDCFLTVHDELDGDNEDTPEGQEALEHVKHIMENCIKLEVPIFAKLGQGNNWAEAK